LRAEWLRIEAEIKALQSKDGVKLYNLHHLGYRLAGYVGDLTPLQSWFMSSLDGYIDSIRKSRR